MIKMAEHLKGYWPNQLSFSESCGIGDENADDIAGRFTGTYTGAGCAILQVWDNL
ncbi:putative transposase [Shigella flexneri 1235-66]|nr:putative transposase [Shigella flexneri 1235-66]